MNRSRSRASRLSGMALGLALTATSLAACSSEEEQQVYCVTEDNVVVDEDRCEDNPNSHFLYYGFWGNSYRPGSQLSGGERIAYNDAAGRRSLGLPSSGRISSGSGGFGTTVSKSGGSSSGKVSGGKSSGFGGSFGSGG